MTDKYDIIKLIAATAHSKVYLVQHRLLKELRAAKMVRKACIEHERILKEAFLIRQFRHSGIPLIYDIEEDSNSICIIEEYICGKSLTDYISEYGNLSVTDVVEYGIQICSILEYLHRFNGSGIIHMDLKPDNILIDGNHKVKVIDFDNSIQNNQRMNCQYGSAGYAAPEQYYKSRVDRTADIYSIGMLLMYMIQGGHVQSKTEDRRFRRCRQEEDPLYHNELYPIIRKCIRHNCLQRFHTAEQIEKELLQVRMHNQKKNVIQKSSITKKSYCIYVYGASEGIGTTHIALCITAFIIRNRKKAVMIEKSGKKDMIESLEKEIPESDGSYLFKQVRILPDYGHGIACNVDHYEFKVYDCGTYEHYKSMMDQTDEQGQDDGDREGLRVLVTDAGYGRKQKAKVVKDQQEGTVVAVNHTSGELFYRYTKSQELKMHFVRIPCTYDFNDHGDLINYAMWEILEEQFPGMFRIYRRKGGCLFLRNWK